MTPKFDSADGLGVLGAFAGQDIKVRHTRTDPVDTDKSVADTIELMREVVISYAHNPIVVSAVQKATNDLAPSASDKDVVRAIYYWVKANLTFVEDETLLKQALGYSDLDLDKELLITPDTLLSMPKPMGDCDDFSLLIATMCYSYQLPVWFVTIAADSEYPAKFSHVYVKVLLVDSGETIYLDASHGNYPGWEYGRAFRKKEWAI